MTSLTNNVVAAAKRGFLDSISFHRAVVVIVRSPKVRSKLVQCLLLNGLIFLGSILVFHWILGPLLSRIISTVLPQRNAAPEIGSIISLWVSWVYYSLWIAPLYIMTFILNTLWYRDIAVESVEFFSRHAATSSSTPPAQSGAQASIPGQIADILLRSLFNVVYLCYLTVLARYRILYAVSLAFLISFNAFEFKYRNLSFNQKVNLVESNWVYFLSFSIWVAVLVTEFPTMVENGLLGVLFPFLLINASSAGPLVPVAVPSDTLSRLTLGWLTKFRVLFIVEKLTDAVVFIIYNVSKKRNRIVN